MKKIMFFMVGLLLVSTSVVLAVEPRTQSTDRTNTTTSSVPTISSLGFSSPKPGSVFNFGDKVPVSWSYQSTGDVSNITANLSLMYWGANGVKYNVIVLPVYLSTKTATISIPNASDYKYPTDLPKNMSICLDLFNNNQAMGVSSCAPAFTLNQPITTTISTIDTTRPTISEQTTNNAVNNKTAIDASNEAAQAFAPLDMKLVEPKNSKKYYLGEDVVIKWSYNPNFLGLGTLTPGTAQLEVEQDNPNWMMGLFNYQVAKVDVPISSSANQFLVLNKIASNQKLSAGKYIVVFSYNNSNYYGGFEVINKIAPVNTQPKNVSATQNQNTAPIAPEVKNVSSDYQNKLKSAIYHLKQATAILETLVVN